MAKSPSGHDYLLKVVHVGDSGVGKSGILLKYCDDDFKGKYVATIGVDFKIRTVLVAGKIVKLQLWDTAGQERFKALTSTYYRLAEGFIVCYDITRPATFKNIPSWIRDIRSLSDSDNITIILVGNKLDEAVEPRRDGQVSRRDGEALAQDENILFMETSAKTGHNVQELYAKLLGELIARRKARGEHGSRMGASRTLTDDSQSESSGKCAC